MTETLTETFALAPISSKAMMLNWLLMIPLMLVTLGVGLIVAWFIIASNGTRFELSSESLVIRYPIYGRSLALSELDRESARLVTPDQPDYRLSLRTNGVGLAGYGAGWFRLKNKQKALVFAAAGHPAVYIPTRKDYVLLLTPDRPEQFLQALKGH